MPSVLDAHTRTCAIFGHPVGHSLSPAIHNAAFAALGLNMVYVAHDVQPAQLPAAMAGIRALGYRGLSITIPHKVAALGLVDEVDDTARRIGCVNTVVNDAGVLKGHNSDGLGALGALRAAGIEPNQATVVVLGSGGASRAISVTLVAEAAPKKLTVLGIDESELQGLASVLRELRKSEIVHGRLDRSGLESGLADADLLLHTTPIGMAPKADESVVPRELLHSRLTVFDAVYTPRRTRLLRDASERGCRTIEGLEMFLGQALVQFELWTGKQAPKDVMRRVIEERLGQS
jgi:shikimate dehydrogenase